MRRGVLYVTIAACVVSLLAAAGVEAQRRRRRGRAQQSAQQERQSAPRTSEAIAPALGDVHWGMTPREINDHFAKAIRERFRPRIAKMTDAIGEDRLRTEMNDEINRMRRSYHRFDGTVTGWDSSFIRDEFTHNNQESMLIYRDGNSQNIYFFIQGRLWKWYKAFDASVFEGQTFDQFAEAIQRRFGPASRRTGTLVEGGPSRTWLEWQDNATRLRAIDNTSFYGFYCLVFEDRDTLRRLNELRPNRTQRQEGHSLVDAVLRENNEGDEGDDANQDIADRISGQVRRRTDAPPTKQGQSGSAASQGSGNSRQGGNSNSSGGRSNGGSQGGSGLDLGNL